MKPWPRFATGCMGEYRDHSMTVSQMFPDMLRTRLDGFANPGVISSAMTAPSAITSPILEAVADTLWRLSAEGKIEKYYSTADDYHRGGRCTASFLFLGQRFRCHENEGHISFRSSCRGARLR